MVFVKGQSGNPGGRPKRDWTWAEVLEDVGELIEEKSGKKFKEIVAKRIWVESANGNTQAIKELLNRMDGMPTQSIKASVTSEVDEGVAKLSQIIKANEPK